MGYLIKKWDILLVTLFRASLLWHVYSLSQLFTMFCECYDSMNKLQFTFGLPSLSIRMFSSFKSLCVILFCWEEERDDI